MRLLYLKTVQNESCTGSLARASCLVLEDWPEPQSCAGRLARTKDLCWKTGQSQSLVLEDWSEKQSYAGKPAGARAPTTSYSKTSGVRVSTLALLPAALYTCEGKEKKKP